MFKRIFLILVLLTGLNTAYAEDEKSWQNTEESNAQEIRTVNGYDLRRAIDGEIKMKLLDVRARHSYVKGHIKTALSLPLDDITAISLEKFAPEKNEMVIFYSDSNDSSESSAAANKALSYGYKKVYNYNGGFEDWEEKAFTIVKAP